MIPTSGYDYINAWINITFVGIVIFIQILLNVLYKIAHIWQNNHVRSAPAGHFLRLITEGYLLAIYEGSLCLYYVLIY